MKIKLVLFSALLLAATWSVAFAQEGASNDDDIFALENFGASVTLASDYVFRGISQTDQDPAVQGSFDYKHPLGVYLGVWASNVDENVSKGNIEIDYYGGYTKELLTSQSSTTVILAAEAIQSRTTSKGISVYPMDLRIFPPNLL